MKFRKKPVVIDAERTMSLISNSRHSWSSLPDWFRAAYEEGFVLILPDKIVIKTLEGEMVAKPGDWIIRGVQGELYPCKPDIFEATYEALPAEGATP